jgi:hypothetical protein
MNKFAITMAVMLLSMAGYAQTDSTKKEQVDTVHVGNFVIIKKNKNGETTEYSHGDINISIGSNKRTPQNISTNWFIFDLGFANVRDNTNYTTAAQSGYLQTNGGPAFTANDFSLRANKTSNVNIWIFMQKLNLYKHIVNLKYGLGLEMYNFRYETNISYGHNPPRIYRDTILFSKNKLATDYATIPFMININPYPTKRRAFSFSFGVSAGYLYNSRNKQISDERGKEKVKGDIGIDKWRIAYVGELGLGAVRVYGSYSINPLHQNALEQYPYAIGLRFSNW